MPRRLFLALFMLVALLSHSTGFAGNVPVIAAASDLSYALGKVAKRFTEASGRKVRISFGSSGNLKRQIEQGGPFELFMSADENYVLQLAEQGLTRDQGALYAIGRLVLFAPHGSPLAEKLEYAELSRLLHNGEIRKFAIANPVHAPYGRAARETLVTINLWEQIQDSLVFGENASQATLFAVSGATQGALIPHAHALNPQVAKKGRFRLIDQHLHNPLRQRMVLLKNAGATAQQFYAYLQEPEAQAILREYGFTVAADR